MVVQRIWVQSGRLFFKTPFLYVSCLAGYVYLFVHLCQQQAWLSVGDSGSVATYLNKGQGIGLILFLLLAVVAFEFCSMERVCGAEECLSVDRHAQKNVKLGRVLLLVPFVLITSLTAFLYQLISLKTVDCMTAQVLHHVFLSCLLNVCLAQVIGIFFGVMLASLFKRPAAYTCVAAFTFLTTTTAKELVGLLCGASGGIGSFFSRAMDLFSITAVDTDWMLDDIYGVPIETSRWIASLFWILLFAAIFLWKNRTRNIKKTYLAPALSGCIALLALVAFLSSENDSVVRLDTRTTSINGEYNYEISHEQRSEAADFEILSYQMELSAHRKLDATVTMTIMPNAQDDCYRFTLYRGYHITSVTDEQGNELSFERDGHYLAVHYSTEAETGAITVNYKGSGGRFFSNDQGISLLGYVPWYPVAGYVPLWDAETNTISTYIPDTSADFSIVFDTDLPLATNLEQTGTNTYAGTANAVTFVGGLLTEKESDGITYFDSQLNAYQIDFAAIRKTLDSAEEIFGVSLGFNLDEKKVIVQPRLVSASTGGASLSVVCFSDHMLVSAGMDIPYALLEQLVPQKEGATELNELLIHYLYYGVDAEPYYSDGTAYALAMPDRSKLEAIVSWEEEGYDESTMAFEQALRYQMSEYGASYVLRACYDYLQSDSQESQVDFIYGLGG
jgi:hypothetical protein